MTKNLWRAVDATQAASHRVADAIELITSHQYSDSDRAKLRELERAAHDAIIAIAAFAQDVRPEGAK